MISKNVLSETVNDQSVAFNSRHRELLVGDFENDKICSFALLLSTEDAIVELTDDISNNLDKGQRCIGIFLDLAKAFDTVSVKILLKKLELIGIRGLPLKLFASFLTDRRQTVKVADHISHPLPVTCGVPQGSVLGPSLFLIYINELCQLKPLNGKIISYADDTALVFRGQTWAEARSYAEQGLKLAASWLNKNLLTLNTQKSKYITFSINKSTQP